MTLRAGLGTADTEYPLVDVQNALVRNVCLTTYLFWTASLDATEAARGLPCLTRPKVLYDRYPAFALSRR